MDIRLLVKEPFDGRKKGDFIEDAHEIDTALAQNHDKVLRVYVSK